MVRESLSDCSFTEGTRGGWGDFKSAAAPGSLIKTQYVCLLVPCELMDKKAPVKYFKMGINEEQWHINTELLFIDKFKPCG